MRQSLPTYHKTDKPLATKASFSSTQRLWTTGGQWCNQKGLMTLLHQQIKSKRSSGNVIMSKASRLTALSSTGLPSSQRATKVAPNWKCRSSTWHHGTCFRRETRQAYQLMKQTDQVSCLIFHRSWSWRREVESRVMISSPRFNRSSSPADKTSWKACSNYPTTWRTRKWIPLSTKLTAHLMKTSRPWKTSFIRRRTQSMEAIVIMIPWSKKNGMKKIQLFQKARSRWRCHNSCELKEIKLSASRLLDEPMVN